MGYFVVHCLLQGEIAWSDFLGGLHEYSVLGNPTWFILMTLLTYLLAFACFSLVGAHRPNLFVSILAGLLIIAIYLVGKIKPSHWVNTLLCFPVGMLYYLHGERIEAIFKRTRMPSIVWAFLLLALGWYIYRANIWPHVCSENMGGILFAIGVTWFVGCFSWKAPSRSLVWLGGSGLFSVYMFHLLPMRVITRLGLNEGNPYLVWLSGILSASAIIYVAYIGYKKLNQLFFSK